MCVNLSLNYNESVMVYLFYGKQESRSTKKEWENESDINIRKKLYSSNEISIDSNIDTKSIDTN